MSEAAGATEPRETWTATLTPERIGELRRLLKKTTPLPWEVRGKEVFAPCPCCGHVGTMLFEEDAAATAALRNAAPALLDAAETAAAAAARVQEVEAENERLRGFKEASLNQHRRVEQVLGKVLGYPWYKDDPKNFPGATEADGVCIGDHTSDTLASSAAENIERLTRQNAALTERLTRAESVIEAGVKVMDFLENVPLHFTPNNGIAEFVNALDAYETHKAKTQTADSGETDIAAWQAQGHVPCRRGCCCRNCDTPREELAVRKCPGMEDSGETEREQRGQEEGGR